MPLERPLKCIKMYLLVFISHGISYIFEIILNNDSNSYSKNQIVEKKLCGDFNIMYLSNKANFVMK